MSNKIMWRAPEVPTPIPLLVPTVFKTGLKAA